VPATITTTRATLDDLMRHDGNAELIAGVLVPKMSTGFRPNIVAGRIFVRLAGYADSVGVGVVYTDGIGFAVPELSSGRESFSPDAAYYTGTLPANEMRFVPGPPDFAVEVRSENDYGRAADAEYAAKRADYFEAGTLVVWDVDPVAVVVHRYAAGNPQPTTLAAGDEADAEPALPGWRVAVDWIMG
jgi:Uma2 family endonuclease